MYVLVVPSFVLILIVKAGAESLVLSFFAGLGFGMSHRAAFYWATFARAAVMRKEWGSFGTRTHGRSVMASTIGFEAA
jgi:hypothetical protein